MSTVNPSPNAKTSGRREPAVQQSQGLPAFAPDGKAYEVHRVAAADLPKDVRLVHGVTLNAVASKESTGAETDCLTAAPQDFRTDLSWSASERKFYAETDYAPGETVTTEGETPVHAINGLNTILNERGAELLRRREQLLAESAKQAAEMEGLAAHPALILSLPTIPVPRTLGQAAAQAVRNDIELPPRDARSAQDPDASAVKLRNDVQLPPREATQQPSPNVMAARLIAPSLGQAAAVWQAAQTRDGAGTGKEKGESTSEGKGSRERPSEASYYSPLPVGGISLPPRNETSAAISANDRTRRLRFSRSI